MDTAKSVISMTLVIEQAPRTLGPLQRQAKSPCPDQLSEGTEGTRHTKDNSVVLSSHEHFAECESQKHIP
jgi:hypothetical protein